jgi:hypothetical protein
MGVNHSAFLAGTEQRRVVAGIYNGCPSSGVLGNEDGSVIQNAHNCVDSVRLACITTAMSNTLQCDLCETLVPIVKQRAGKALGLALGTAFGFRSKSLGGLVAAATAGILVGHAIDAVTAPVCGGCGSRVSS